VRKASSSAGDAEVRPRSPGPFDDRWRLAIVWLLAVLRPAGPYPILALSGEQTGSHSQPACCGGSLAHVAKLGADARTRSCCISTPRSLGRSRR
jgi:hypothetical protein